MHMYVQFLNAALRSRSDEIILRIHLVKWIYRVPCRVGGDLGCLSDTSLISLRRKKHAGCSYRTQLFRPLRYERVYLPLYKVADTPFHIYVDDLLAWWQAGFTVLRHIYMEVSPQGGDPLYDYDCWWSMWLPLVRLYAPAKQNFFNQSLKYRINDILGRKSYFSSDSKRPVSKL